MKKARVSASAQHVLMAAKNDLYSSISASAEAWRQNCTAMLLNGTALNRVGDY
jgi:hypothetical protein